MANPATELKFLSPEWCRAATDLLNEDEEASGLAAWADLTIQYVIESVPGSGEVRYYRRFSDGEVTVALGEADSVSLKLTLPYDVAVQIHLGALDVPAAFGQGKLAVEGELGPLMSYSGELSSVTRAIASMPTAY